MRTRENMIQIRVTQEERDTIAEHAAKLNMQIAPYVRRAAMNPQIIQVDYSAISKHTEEMAKIRSEINRLVFTIEATNNYLPREIETIVNLMNELFKSENQLLKTMREARNVK